MSKSTVNGHVVSLTPGTDYAGRPEYTVRVGDEVIGTVGKIEVDTSPRIPGRRIVIFHRTSERWTYTRPGEWGGRVSYDTRKQALERLVHWWEDARKAVRP